MEYELWGCSQQPYPKSSKNAQVFVSFALPDYVEERPLQSWVRCLATAGPSLPPWAAGGSASCARCSGLMPKTQALLTPELIWSNIYSVIKKLFISLSDDKIIVK